MDQNSTSGKSRVSHAAQGEQTRYQDAFDLLSARRYKQVQQLLLKQQEGAQKSGQMAMVIILAAACQLCLTCRQFQADREHHQLGLEESKRRERESRLQIQTVLAMLSQLSSLETQVQAQTSSGHVATPSEVGRPAESSDKQPTLMQKVKQLLGFEPTSTIDKSAAGMDHAAEKTHTSPLDRQGSVRSIRHPSRDQEMPQETDSSPLGDQELLQAVAALLTGSAEEEVSQEPDEGSPGPSVAAAEAESAVADPAGSLAAGDRPLEEEGTRLPLLDDTADVSDQLSQQKTAAATPVPDQAEGELTAVEASIPADSQSDLQDSGPTIPYLLPPPPNVAHAPAPDQPSYLPPLPKVELLEDLPQEMDPPPSLRLELPLVAPDKDTGTESASLVVYCLGPFRVYQNNEFITEWSGFMGQKILKYLVAQRVKPVPKEVLMEVMWADVGQEAARRNLHQAIYSLRQTLRRREPNLQHILFENDHYLLNPVTGLWIDFLQFEKNVKNGQRLDAAGETEEALEVYGVAEGLYQGSFLAEDMYEEWTNSQRDYLLNLYLEIVERLSEHFRKRRDNVAAVALCQKALQQDPCFESAHRRLMQCYLAQGQRHLAIRQYHTCVQIMQEELELRPSPETEELFQRITA